MWLSVLLIFCIIAFSIDVSNLLIRIGGFIFEKDMSKVIIYPSQAFTVSVVHAIALTIYGYIKAKGLPVERLTIKTTKLPEGINKLIIAHISDLHLGIILRGERLEKVLKVIESEKPDIIVSTGDILDAEINHVDYLTERLNIVNARLGKFAVTGNHEFYGGIKHSLMFLQNAGFTVLRGEGITVENLINITGVDDPTGRHIKSSGTNPSNVSEKEILSKLPPHLFTILLKHRPRIDDNSLGFFDLQLSGHTHKGQIFPIGIVTKLIYGTHSGYSKLPGGSAIYVSRGAGTAGPPVRLLALPEITIIEIIREKPDIC
ncbi:MAG: metallophosphoesterase [Nitrospirae bacterium]|nr:metallophosphoesterase [Nitrospirota bacterium]